MDKIYEMKLHETIESKDGRGLFIRRVPGGWIYNQTDVTVPLGVWTLKTSVFVPFSGEFMEKDNGN